MYIHVDEVARLPLLLNPTIRILSVFINTEINSLVMIWYATLNV